MKNPIYLTLSLAAVLLIGASCNKIEKVTCSAEFRTVTVGVIDDMGAPVIGATVITTRQSNGDTIKLGVAQPFTGDYVVLTDNQKLNVKPDGENFKFLVRKDNKVVSGIFRIKSDYCHIYYISGPDQLILR